MNYELVNSLQEAIRRCEDLIRRCENNEEIIEEALGGDLMRLYISGEEKTLSKLKKLKERLKNMLDQEKSLSNGM
ncbi:MAG: hypothetical protein MJ105_00935 [Lachnospiraceae bacterium]|nr:hypothetical protein [Lachnospiraceae bacterium]